MRYKIIEYIQADGDSHFIVKYKKWGIWWRTKTPDWDGEYSAIYRSKEDVNKAIKEHNQDELRNTIINKEVTEVVK